MNRILTGLYSLLLYCYPPAHRREYGRWMAQLFADQLRAARRQGAVPALLLGTAWDALTTIPAEHAAALFNREPIGVGWMKPVEWKHVLLALLPGILMVGSSFTTPTNDLWIIAPLVGLSLAVIAASLLTQRRLTEWALPALGLLTATAVLLIGYAITWQGSGPPPTWRRIVNTGILLTTFALPGMLLLGLIVQRQLTGHNLRRTWRVLAAMLIVPLAFALAEVLFTDTSPWPSAPLLGLTSFAASAPFVMLGLPLARRHGMRAGLYLVGAASLLTISLLEPAYGLWDTIWGDALPALMLAGYLVAAPLLVMRAGQKGGKARGMLLPVGVALLLSVIIPALVRGYNLATPLFGLAWAVQFWLMLLLAITLYDDLHGGAGAQTVPSADAPATQRAASDSQPGDKRFSARRVFQQKWATLQVRIKKTGTRV
jgi:hypothetical protein